MHAHSCLPKDIIEINKSKEYTLISTHLLESVLTDNKLNAQTTKLWQILFSKARYNENLEIKISYAYLAKKLGRSARTISRYIDTLINAGYLVVKHNFDKNGGQRPNTISVRVPDNIIQQVRQNKDRYTKNDCNSNNTVVNYNHEEPLTSDKYENRLAATETKTKTTAQNVLCETSITSSMSDGDNIHPKEPLQSSLIPQEQKNKANDNIIANPTFEIRSPSTNQIINPTYDNIDRGGDDINGIHKDNNKKDINNNNNIVVVSDSKNSSSINTPIMLLEQKIKTLRQQLTIKNEQIGKLKDHQLRYEQIRKATEIEGELNVTRFILERTKKQIETSFLENLNQSKISDDPMYMFKKLGERSLTLFTFKRLVKLLEALGYGGNTLNYLINEIVFEARFGSLTKCNKSQMPLDLNNAINIAIKLVREKRWTTPKLFKEYTSNGV